MLQGLRVVLVGGRLADKPYVLESAQRLGLHLITAIDEGNEDALPAGMVPDLSWNATGAEAEFERAADALAAALKGRQVDGVVTFWDYCTPLAALLAERLGVARCPADSYWTAKSKLRTYEKLLAAGSPYPPRVYRPDPDDAADIAAGADAVGLPAVLRLSHGNSAIGTRLVGSCEEIEREARRLRELVADEQYAGVGSFANQVLLVEYLTGTEHDVDIVLAEGAPVFAFVTDNGPTDLPYFRETSHLMPSALPTATQDTLVQAAVDCLNGLGLRNGTFNVELRNGPKGPRLLEINARTGGFYIPRLTRWMWDYDLCEAAFALACGRPCPKAPATFRSYLAGFMCFPSDQVEKSGAPPDMLETFLGQYDVAEYEEPVRSLSFPGATAEEAVHVAMRQAHRILGERRGAVVAAYLRTLLPSAQG